MSTTPTLPCCRRTKTQIIFETAAGQRITLQNSPGSILIEDSNGNTIRLDSTGINILSSAKVVVSSSQVEISASVVTVNASMTTFAGTIKADTLIANSVVASSYTPGAGNIW